MSDEPRALIAQGLASYLTEGQVQKLIDEILAINKRASAEFTCKKCKARQMQWTEIPDAKAVASALGDLLAQGFGRPVEASEKAEPIQFRRLTVMDDDDEVERALLSLQANRRRHADQRREDGSDHRSPETEGLQQAEEPSDSESGSSRDVEEIGD